MPHPPTASRGRVFTVPGVFHILRAPSTSVGSAGSAQRANCRGASTMSSPAGIQVTWLGHSTFKIVSAGGKTLVIDPWLDNNPSCPADKKSFENLDLILLTHGHFDHFDD